MNTFSVSLYQRGLGPSGTITTTTRVHHSSKSNCHWLPRAAVLPLLLALILLSGVAQAQSVQTVDISTLDDILYHQGAYYAISRDGLVRMEADTWTPTLLLPYEDILVCFGVTEETWHEKQELPWYDDCARLASDGQCLYYLSFRYGSILAVEKGGLREVQTMDVDPNELNTLYYRGAIVADGRFYTLRHLYAGNDEFVAIQPNGKVQVITQASQLEGPAVWQGAPALGRVGSEGMEIVTYTPQGQPLEVVYTFARQTFQGLCASPAGDCLYALSAGQLWRVQPGKAEALRPVTQPSFPQIIATEEGVLAGALYFEKSMTYYPFTMTPGETVLTIHGITTSPNLDSDFALENPGISISRQEGWSYSAQEMYTDILNQSPEVDLYCVELNSTVVRMMDKGYLLPLTDRALLQDNAALYPVYAQAMGREGMLYAVPATATLEPWAVTRDGETSALTSWDALFQQIRASAEADETPFIGYGSGLKTDAIAWPAIDLAAAYTALYTLEHADSLDFGTAEFTEAMEAIRALAPLLPAGEAAQLNVQTPLLASGLRSENSWLHSCFALYGPEGDALDFLPPPSTLGDGPGTVIATVTVYVVNPYTRHPEEAMTFLRYVAAHRPPVDHALLAADAEPYCFDSDILAHDDEKIAKYEAQLSTATAAHQAQLQENIDYLRNEQTRIMNDPARWAVWGKTLLQYRESLIPHVRVNVSPYLGGRVHHSDNDLWQSLLQALRLYLDGSMELRQCTERMNRVVQMHQMENQ